MTNISIKRLRAEDWKTWKEIRLEALFKNPEAFGSAYEEEATWRKPDWTSGLRDHAIFAAFVGKTVVGVAGLLLSKSLKRKHRGTLFTVYVQEKHRGKGIADELIQKIMEFAKGKVLQLHCAVVISNTPAIQLYEKHGFSVYGLEPRSLKVGDHFYDEYMMIKRLDKA